MTPILGLPQSGTSPYGSELYPTISVGRKMRYKPSKRRQFESSLLLLCLIFSFPIQSCHNLTVVEVKRSQPPKYLIHKYSNYPRWFWQMPHSNTALFAVGYAQTYFHRDTSVEEATENGIRSLAKSVSIRIKGERGFMDTVYGSEFAGEYFQEEFKDGALDFVKENYEVVATETVGNKQPPTPYNKGDITLVLLCSLRSPTTSSYGIGDAPVVSSVKGFNSGRPGWVSEPPKRNGFLYAVGQCHPQYHEEDAWQLAEYDARINLALSLFAQLRSLVKKLDKTLNVITTVKTDVVLNRMQVDKRWVDPKNGIPYVLMRMSLKDNTQSFMNQLRKIVPPQPNHKDKRNIDEIIRKAFEELDSNF